MSVFVAQLDPDAAGHLAVALHRHRAALEEIGRAFPPALDELEALAVRAVTSGQERPGADSVLAGRDRAAHDDDPHQRDWLTTDDAAHVAGVSPRTVRRWIANGDLPTARAGRARRIHRPDLDAFLRS